MELKGNCTILGILLSMFMVAGMLLPSRVHAGQDYNYYELDTSPSWKACSNRCMQNDEFGILTRKGCMVGCDLAKDAFPHKGMRYRDISWCLRDVESLNLTSHVETLEKTCKSRWNHIFKRRGCTDAVKEYYSEWSTALCVMQELPVTAGQPETVEMNAMESSQSVETVEPMDSLAFPPSSVSPVLTGKGRHFRPGAVKTTE